MHRIHIFGASGSGTTTLGQKISEKLHIPHFDTDDYYWKRTNPPYTEKNPIPERQRLILGEMSSLNSWVLSGAMDSWSAPFEPFFSLVVFLYVPTEIRSQRLKRREFERFGERILPSGDMHQAHLDFIMWAEQYDQGLMSGRSRARHEEWMGRLRCPVLRIEGEVSIEEAVARIAEILKG